MNSDCFKRCGYQLVDWAIQYMNTLRERNPLPDVNPGWLWHICPQDAPLEPEKFEDILRDLEPIVLDGMVHWQHPQFFSYFPAGNSWASIMGDIFSNATGANGTTWDSCPVLTELELMVTDWCCKFLNLPKFFLSPYSCPGSEGIGIIQQCASECIFYSMVWAREDAMKSLKQKFPKRPKGVLCNMLAAYCNNECHPCVEKAAYMGLIRLRKLEPDDNGGAIKGSTLRRAVEEDIGKGLIPFFHVAVIGSTGITATDDLMEVGPVCEEYGIWLHCDAAYAGSCWACPEMRYLLPGFKYVWSTNINANKWMMCNFEASLHWIRYSSKAIDPMVGWNDEVYKTPSMPDYKHYAIQSSRRFRALKLWCLIRNYGVEGIRRHTRNHTNLAKLFEKYVKRDERFEVCGSVQFGLVSFRLKGLNEVNSKLLDALNLSRKIHMMQKLDLHHVPSHFQDKVVLRLVVCSEHASERDIDEAWHLITLFASVLLRQYEREKSDNPAMQTLYQKQKRYDKRHGHTRSSEDLSAEEEEATKVFSQLRTRRMSKVHGILQDVPLTFGSVSGHVDIFQQYDEQLMEHPELLEHNEARQRNLPEARTVSSMLHWDLLRSTMTNVDKRNVNF